MEEGLIPVIDSMLAGKIEFYRENDSAQEFIHAICFQYMRTKKMRETIAAIGPTPVPGSDIKRCSALFMLISTMRFADSLYRRRNQFKIVLLDNETATPFITSDQPVINVRATGSEAPPEKLELFYPLSPKWAMMLLELATERPTALSIDEVRQFNELILRNSHEQVFSNSRECLDGLRTDGSEL